MSSGPEMLMQAALKAFVPKETAEKVALAIEGMLRDGTLDGIGSLVADIQEIKRQQGQIILGLGRIMAEVQTLHREQSVHAGGEKDGLQGSAAAGFGGAMAPEYRSQLIAGPGSIGDAGGEPDGVGERSERELPNTGDGYDRFTGTDRETGTRTGEAAE